jgi:hypothetical protein
MPFVWKVLWMVRPPACSRWSATARRKKSSPAAVGSPPCHAKVTSGASWAAM